ncbi:SNF2 family N-terminal domain-containing protein [Poronia punctata]|nr:SNF2 family N-terminal domain-containing protein [Poronia punctata]
MAPVTRRSMGRARAVAAADSTNLNSPTTNAAKSAVPPKRSRGRPRKIHPHLEVGGNSDSASTPATPATVVSDAGESTSTPATSNNATPAPPMIGIADTSSRRHALRRGRLQFSLPSNIEDDDDDDDNDDDDYLAQPDKSKVTADSGSEKQATAVPTANKRKGGSSCLPTRPAKSQKKEPAPAPAPAPEPKNPVDSDDSSLSEISDASDDDADSDSDSMQWALEYTEDNTQAPSSARARAALYLESVGRRLPSGARRLVSERKRLEKNHPELKTMWDELESMPELNAGIAQQPPTISLKLKPFQLQGLAWMRAMEKTSYKGGLLGDEMGLGKTIQAVSLIMSDYPAKEPSLVLLPPVALGQWQDEIAAYTGGKLNTIVFHGTNAKAKNLPAKELKKFDVIIMSYNSLESLYRRQEKGVERKKCLYKEKSAIHQIRFHRVILDEAHCIKTRTTMTAKACFALNVKYRWCLTGTPLQNRIGEFFSLIRFLEVKPFACYFCRDCPCATLEWLMNEESRCAECDHGSMRHVSVFNQELLNPIQKYGNTGEGQVAFRKLRLLTNRIMLRRLKKDHTNVMELPVKEVYVDRQFFGEEENDFAASIMSNTERQFNTYVAQGVLLNNYANIFGLIMQMRQVADHPDLILRKSGEGGQNILVCCICDEPAEEAIRSKCKHDFCRQCATSYLGSQIEPDCPRCHIPLSIDLEQPSIEQDEMLMKKSSIINRIKMENWTSSSKIELLVHELHKLRSDNASHKSIIFSQFTTMLQLIEWRLRRAGITTVMLDGSMTPAQRQASIKHFMEKTEVECFLVSLKAGGVALNLTEASHVFIVDPWWNPAAEWQSADRCHRIGQTRPCTITRLCIEDSVESRMVLLQEKKTHMIHSTINSDDAAIESLSPADLMFLFRGN